jgi:hypothetical protein
VCIVGKGAGDVTKRLIDIPVAGEQHMRRSVAEDSTQLGEPG